MAINKTFIHFNTKAEFESQLAKNNILDTSICFIKDTQEVYTHSQFYIGASPSICKVESFDWGDIYTTPYDVHIVLKKTLDNLPNEITEPIELDVTYKYSTIQWDGSSLTVYEGLNKNVYLHENANSYNTYKLYMYTPTNYENLPCDQFYWGREVLEVDGSYKGTNNNLSLNIIGVKMDENVFKLKEIWG